MVDDNKEVVQCDSDHSEKFVQCNAKHCTLPVSSKAIIDLLRNNVDGLSAKEIVNRIPSSRRMIYYDLKRLIAKNVLTYSHE